MKNKLLLLLLSLIFANCTVSCSRILTPKEEILTELILEIIARKDKEFENILENVGSSLELNNDIIAKQQSYLVDYKYNNNLKLVILTALTSSAITAIICKYKNEIFCKLATLTN